MPSIRAKDKQVFWAVGDPIVASGITEAGDETVTGLVMFSDIDEKIFLSKTKGKVGTYNPLPQVGEWIEQGIYSYKGELVISNQPHILKSDEIGIIL